MNSFLPSYLFSASILLASTAAAARMPQVADVTVSDLQVGRDGSRLNLAFDMDFSGMPTARNVETRITPVIKAGNDSVRLESVTLAGRNRMIQAERQQRLESDSNRYYRAGKTTT
ncbi:MAG: DUF3868 domain-containing protein, partial [Muribaculaceae bacterium]|nr:DUF3868 domain-containing protein [Muribaculaceae bacterium]